MPTMRSRRVASSSCRAARATAWCAPTRRPAPRPSAAAGSPSSSSGRFPEPPNAGGEDDMGALDGRVAIITGAGRGIGREHALLFASEGAKVVVNDLGGANDGSGSDQPPAQEVVAEIKAMGGEAVANADNVADWEGGQRMVNAAIEAFGDLHVLANNAGTPR